MAPWRRKFSDMLSSSKAACRPRPSWRSRHSGPRPTGTWRPPPSPASGVKGGARAFTSTFSISAHWKRHSASVPALHKSGRLRTAASVQVTQSFGRVAFSCLAWEEICRCEWTSPHNLFTWDWSEGAHFAAMTNLAACCGVVCRTRHCTDPRTAQHYDLALAVEVRWCPL